MEISSDLGYGDDQGDIDIDLDLTAGPGDEDYVLEDADANCNTDFANDFHAQTLAAVNDEIMVDDDDKSYQMEDAEVMDEETEHIIEQESMSFANDGDAVDAQIGEQHVASEANGHYDDLELTNDETLEFDLQDYTQQDRQAALPEDVQDVVAPHTKIADDSKQDAPVRESQTPNSNHHSPPLFAPTEPRSLAATVVEAAGTSPHLSPDHTGPALPDKTEVVNTEGLHVSSNLQHVVVVYREVEYKLFSNSEHDDPDSYFLSDISIAEKPLSALFAAIREVIREDLAEEDELCIVVDSLGLQAEEVSSIVEDVTLSQVLDLFAKLSQNDEPEYAGGCHMILKTRSNFSRRFANLSQAAAEGLGLSAFTYWDDQSIGPDDSEDLQESKNEFVPVIKDQKINATAEDDEEQPQYKHPENNDTGNNLAAQHADHDGLHLSGLPTSNVQHQPIPEGTSAAGESKIASSKSAASEVSDKMQDHGSDIDEDGDLIDYSEEEDVAIEKRSALTKHTDEQEGNTGTYTDFISSNCALPQTCFCSKCSDLIVEDFQKKDELLRRRSLDRRQSSSGAAPEEDEEELGESDSGDQELKTEAEASESTDDHARGRERPKPQVAKAENLDENEIRYEEFAPEEREDLAANDYENFTEDHLEHGEDQTKNGGLVIASIIQAGTENDENIDPHELNGNGEDFDDTHPYNEFSALQDNYSGAPTADFENEGLEFDIEGVNSFDETRWPQTHGDHVLELDERNGTIDLLRPSKSSSLDALETADSSVTMDADEIQYEDSTRDETGNLPGLDTHATSERIKSPKVASVVEPKDEIDYEDDEAEIEPSAQISAGPQATQNGNGKRSITHVEFNDAQVSQTNDAKRPRS
ncbi:uncharacterized protein RAG0_13332 [Rhynchosporium agropyri]|uniref:Glutamic acid-rich protein n=1 Tax=Rhynchosporium agropyri TaxID=914238 RepID=A0A1E1LCA5_9HELO|nr:uncharacterized protein RAG0_13332 [Rhynchosporium agropyri]